MSTERNADRIVRAWLDQMPDEAPDRVIAAVLQAAETTPQQRPSWSSGRWRLPIVTRFQLIAAVAVIAIAIGGMVVLGPRLSSQVAAPSATPALASPSAGPTGQPSADAGGPLPAALAYGWIGQSRDVPGFGSSTRTRLNLDATTFCMTGTQYGEGCAMLASDASAPAGTELRLITHAPGTGCQVGDVGSYRWSLSPGGTMLTVEPAADDCAARSAALAGTWYRVGCKNSTDGCFGNLEAGTYPSQYLVPRRNPGDAWEPDLGAVTYTVPDGWANSADWPNNLALTPAVDYALEGPDGPADGAIHELDLLAQPFAAVQDGSCSGAADTSVDRSVDGLAAWLGQVPGLQVTKPEPVTVDGHPGLMMAIQLSGDWTSRCPGSASPSVEILTREQDHGSDWGIALFGGERQGLTLVDLGDGDVLGILVDSSDPSRFSNLASAAQPIIDSLHIR